MTLVGLLALGAVQFGTSPAQAASYASVLRQQAQVRWCTTLTNSVCMPMNTMNKGDRVNMICWQDDTPFATVESSPRWFLVEFQRNHLVGYVHAPQVAPWAQTSVPNCWWKSDTGTANAAFARATGWSGTANVSTARKASAADINRTPWAWTPGPRGEWSGDCVAFAFLAQGDLNLSMWVQGHAWQVAEYYRSQRIARTDGAPPRGSLVMWGKDPADAGSVGHVAISAGNGWAIGTVGNDWSNAALKVYPISNIGGTVSWAQLNQS